MIIGFMTFLPGESSSRPCSGALILSLAACFGPTSHGPPPPAGYYHCRIAYYTWRGRKGFRYDSIPAW